MNKICGIYYIINKINKKTYIGSSCDIKRRWRHHRQNLNQGIHHCVYLQRAWNKYGKNNFIFRVYQKCDRENLIKTEQNLLNKAKQKRKKYYNTSYYAGGQEPKLITEKQKQDIKNYWLKNNTASTFVYAKNKYGFGMLLIQYLLVDIRKETPKRPQPKHNINPTVYKFYHRDGTIFIGRQYDFKKKYNIRHSGLCGLIAGRYKTTSGWSLILKDV
jgi:predicted GIY-YIG superfamily endonuclease